MDLTPEVFFDKLREYDFTIRTNVDFRSALDFAGTVRMRKTHFYIAYREVNGHLIVISGHIHLIDTEVCISAEAMMTTTLWRKCGCKSDVPTYKKLDPVDFGDMLRWSKMMDDLPPCEDYKLLTGD